jgi:hypothetical protein
MNLGMSKNPNWAFNLEANPRAVIELRGEAIAVLARRAVGADAKRLWRRWLHLQLSAEAFSELSGREVPLFILTRSTSDDPAQFIAPGCRCSSDEHRQ